MSDVWGSQRNFGGDMQVNCPSTTTLCGVCLSVADCCFSIALWASLSPSRSLCMFWVALDVHECQVSEFLWAAAPEINPQIQFLPCALKLVVAGRGIVQEHGRA